MSYLLHERGESHQSEQGNNAPFVSLGPINRILRIAIWVKVNDLAGIVAIFAGYALEATTLNGSEQRLSLVHFTCKTNQEGGKLGKLPLARAKS